MGEWWNVLESLAFSKLGRVGEERGGVFCRACGDVYRVGDFVSASLSIRMVTFVLQTGAKKIRKTAFRCDRSVVGKTLIKRGLWRF